MSDASDVEDRADDPADRTDDEIERIKAQKRAELESKLSSPDEPIHVEGSGHLDDIVADNDVVLVDFHADWCGPCQMLEPTVEAIAETTDAAVAKVDVDEHQTLAKEFGVRGVPMLALFAATALPDLDSFVALVSTAGHRTVLHTFVLPIGLGVLWGVDTRLRERSFVRERWGQCGVTVGWMSLVAMAVAGIGLDLIEAGVNPLWPLHDQFYVVEGKIELSDQRGIVQTFVDLSPETEASGPQRLGSSQEVNMSTGVDPDPDGTMEEEDPERLFPIARAGWQLFLLVVGTAVTSARLRMDAE